MQLSCADASQICTLAGLTCATMKQCPRSRLRRLCAGITDNDLSGLSVKRQRSLRPCALFQPLLLCLVKDEQRTSVDVSSPPGRNSNVQNIVSSRLPLNEKSPSPTQHRPNSTQALSTVDAQPTNNGNHPHNLGLRPLRPTNLAKTQKHRRISRRRPRRLLVPLRIHPQRTRQHPDGKPHPFPRPLPKVPRTNNRRRLAPPRPR